MQSNKFILLILILLTYASCKKKELPVDTTGSPVFYFSGTIDNQTYNIEAGNNNYFLETSYATQDSFILMNGSLAVKGCSNNCPNSLSISIADNTFRPSFLISNINEVLNGSHNIFSTDSSASTLDSIQYFQFNCTGVHDSYHWDFGDGTFSDFQNKKHIYDLPSIYNVCLTVTDSGVERTMCNQVDANLSPDYVLSFDYSLNQATSQITLNAPLGWNNYIWSTSDSNSFTTAIVTHTFGAPGIYDASLSATRNGIIKNFIRQVSIQSSVVKSPDWTYSSGYDLNFVPQSISGKVVIDWVDANGIKYSSSPLNQPSSSFFQVLDNSAYDKNNANENTLKLNCMFDMYLYNVANPSQSIHIISDACMWAVAYPQ